MNVKAKQNVVYGGAIFPKDAVFSMDDKAPDPAAVSKMAVGKKKVEETSEKVTHGSNGKPIEKFEETKTESKPYEPAVPAK